MPKIKMTVRGLDAIKPPSKGQVDYWDETSNGLGLRVSSGGKKTWVYMYRLKETGDKRRLTIGSYPGLSLADARGAYTQLAADVAKGNDPAKIKKDLRRAGTFGELADLYMKEKSMGEAYYEWFYSGKKGTEPKPLKKSWFKDLRMLNHDLLPSLEKRKAHAIDEEDVEDVLYAIVNRGAKTQANRSREVLNAIYNWAFKRSKYRREFKLKGNPCFGVERPSAENSRERVLNQNETRMFWNAVSQDLSRNANALKLQLLTGQRGGEVLSMRWELIDLERRWWGIPEEDSKNGKAHGVALSRGAVDLLQDLNEGNVSKGWVFPKATGSGHAPHVQKVMDRVREATGIQDFRQHDLRRTAASYLTSLKIPRLTVAKILNHSDPGITSTYDRYGYDQEKLEALDLLWSELLKTVSSEKEFSNVIPFMPEEYA